MARRKIREIVDRYMGVQGPVDAEDLDQLASEQKGKKAKFLGTDEQGLPAISTASDDEISTSVERAAVELGEKPFLDDGEMTVIVLPGYEEAGRTAVEGRLPGMPVRTGTRYETDSLPARLMQTASSLSGQMKDSSSKEMKALAEKTKKSKEAQQGAPANLIAIGSRGEDVKALQKKLVEEGLLSEEMDVDGIFGPRTQAAVRKLQKKKGLSPDGIVGPQTMKALA